MNDHTYVVLMAGGAGTRFWPLSRRSRPKQALAIDGEQPMIRSTVARLGDEIPPERILVVTGEDQEGTVLLSLPEVPQENVLLEPVPRNTAACIGFAAVTAVERDPDAVLLCLPADHVIRPPDVFRATAGRAIERADSARTLVTFGVLPRWPSTGYGYLKQGRKVAPGIRKVKSFLEKPRKKTAKRFVKDGKHRWNSGMFAWRADVFLEEVEDHLPDLAKGLSRLREDPGRVAEIFPTLPSISVDYGIMEKTGLAEMVKADFHWDDVGSFEAFSRLVEPDGRGNHARGEFLGVGADGIVSIAPEGHMVAALGVKNLVVVVTEDATLVCRRKDAEKVKELVELLPREMQ